MRLIHLPTLDGTVEASVARLDALSRLTAVAEIEDGVWQAGNLVDEMIDAFSDEGSWRDTVMALRSEHEAVLTEVQREIDRLVEESS